MVCPVTHPSHQETIQQNPETGSVSRSIPVRIDEIVITHTHITTNTQSSGRILTYTHTHVFAHRCSTDRTYFTSLVKTATFLKSSVHEHYVITFCVWQECHIIRYYNTCDVYAIACSYNRSQQHVIILQLNSCCDTDSPYITFVIRHWLL